MRENVHPVRFVLLYAILLTKFSEITEVEIGPNLLGGFFFFRGAAQPVLGALPTVKANLPPKRQVTASSSSVSRMFGVLRVIYA